MMTLSLILKNWVTKDVPFALSAAVLVVMFLNGVLADWPQKGLLATSYGPVYPGVHALSVLSVCAAAGFVGTKESVPWAALAGMTTIAVHELVWASLSLFYYGFNQVAGDFYVVAYAAIVFAFFVVGRKHIGTVAAILFLSVGYYTFGVVFLTPALGTDNSIAAIAGWVISSLPWFFI